MDRLPVEMITHIMQFLNMTDQKNASRVSRVWLAAYNDPCLHRGQHTEIRLFNEKLTVERIQKINQCKIRSIRFSDFGYIRERPEASIMLANFEESVSNMHMLGSHVNNISLNLQSALSECMVIMQEEFDCFDEITLDGSHLVKMYSSSRHTTETDICNNILTRTARVTVNVGHLRLDDWDVLFQHLPKVTCLHWPGISDVASLRRLRDLHEKFECTVIIDVLQLTVGSIGSEWQSILSELSEMDDINLRRLHAPWELFPTIVNDCRRYGLEEVHFTVRVRGVRGPFVTHLMDNIPTIQIIRLSICPSLNRIHSLVRNIPGIFKTEINQRRFSSSVDLFFRHNGRVVNLSCCITDGRESNWTCDIVDGLGGSGPSHDLTDLSIVTFDTEDVMIDNYTDWKFSELRNSNVAIKESSMYVGYADDPMSLPQCSDQTWVLEILRSCKKLTRLSLSNCVIKSSSSSMLCCCTFSALTDLRISSQVRIDDAGLTDITSLATNLEYLQVYDSPLVTNDEILQWITALKNLQKIQLERCKLLTTDVVEPILLGCKKLEHLEVPRREGALGSLRTPLHTNVKVFHIEYHLHYLSIDVADTWEVLSSGRLNEIRVTSSFPFLKIYNLQMTHENCGEYMATKFHQWRP